MKVIADLHCHTIACSHAYSTITENCAIAAERGIAAIAMTDHGPEMQDAPHRWHFACIAALPKFIHGVRVLKGAEANIMDFNGRIDIGKYEARALEFVVASMHDNCLEPGSEEEHTRAYLAALENPIVDMLGHSGTACFPYDIDRVVKRCGELNKLIEINSHSFDVREGSRENCREIALCCKKYSVRISVNSDAHYCGEIGKVDAALNMLSEIEFPPELIINTDIERLSKYFKDRKGLDILSKG